MASASEAITSSPETASATVRETLVVDAVDRLSADVVALRLGRVDGSALPSWAPGDHIDIEFEPGLTRQYTLCGPRADDHWRVAIRLDPATRGGSRFAHTRLRAGDVVRVVGPKRRFPLEDAPHHILVAGGIGITPILTMAEHLASEGRPFRVVYFDRGAERMVFSERLHALGALARSIDRAVDSGTTLAGILDDMPEGSLVYACGPRRMLDELRGLVDAQALRVEDFSPETATVPPVDGTATDPPGDAFEVQLGQDGDVLPVPSGCSLLDVLLAAGADIMWSCREGNCASCETTVLEGTPDHRDVILTEDERAANDVVFPCVSRSLSRRLVVEV